MEAEKKKGDRRMMALARSVGSWHTITAAEVLDDPAHRLSSSSRVDPLDLAAWIRIIAVATTILIAVEIDKAVRRRPRPTLGALP